MKKLVVFFLIVVMCVSFVGCGSQKVTIDDVCIEADSLLVEWSKESFAFCYYEGSYEKVNGIYYYIVKATMSQKASDSEYVDYVAVDSSNNILKEVYPALTNLFLEFDVPVMIVVYDEYGNNYSAIVNNEIIYN